jgi:hypothetical protein
MASQLQFHGEPECRSCGAFGVAALEEGPMHPFPDSLAFVLPPHEVGGRREPFEVLGFQRGFPISCLEQPIRGRPSSLLE